MLNLLLRAIPRLPEMTHDERISAMRAWLWKPLSNGKMGLYDRICAYEYECRYNDWQDAASYWQIAEWDLPGGGGVIGDFWQPRNVADR